MYRNTYRILEFNFSDALIVYVKSVIRALSLQAIETGCDYVIMILHYMYYDTCSIVHIVCYDQKYLYIVIDIDIYITKYRVKYVLRNFCRNHTINKYTVYLSIVKIIAFNK